jgi:putative ABC transport system permease protein
MSARDVSRAAPVAAGAHRTGAGTGRSRRGRRRTPAAGPPIARSRLLSADVVRVASVGLRTRRLRAALSALGVAIGIAAMVAVLGISESSKAGLIAELNELGTNLLTVAPGQTFLGANAQLPEASARAVRNLPSVLSAAAVTDVSKATVRRNPFIEAAETGGIAVEAADPQLLATLGGKMVRGRFLESGSERYPLAVLGRVAARRLGVSRLTVAGRPVQVYLGGVWFTVAGIVGPLALAPEIERAVLIGYPIAHALFATTRHASMLYVRASPERVREASSLLGATAYPEHPEDTQVSRPSSALQARADAQSTLTSVFLGLGAVALLVGGVGIANVMVISVLERRPEIGLRRALGARAVHIAVPFLGESVLLSFFGGVCGIALGAAATATYASSQGWIVVVPVLAVGGGVVIALALGALAGLYPAVRAARLAPAAALRSV